MPNSNDAAKRQRQNLKRRSRNRSIKGRVRVSIKSFEKAVEQKNKDEALFSYAHSVKIIDTATGKGVYHRNNAARKKSRMYRKLVALN